MKLPHIAKCTVERTAGGEYKWSWDGPEDWPILISFEAEELFKMQDEDVFASCPYELVRVGEIALEGPEGARAGIYMRRAAI